MIYPFFSQRLGYCTTIQSIMIFPSISNWLETVFGETELAVGDAYVSLFAACSAFLGSQLLVHASWDS